MINYLGLLAFLFFALIIFKKGTIKSDLYELAKLLLKVKLILFSKFIADSRKEKMILVYASLILKFSLKMLLYLIPFGILTLFIEYNSGNFLVWFTSVEGIIASVFFLVLYQLVIRYFATK